MTGSRGTCPCGQIWSGATGRGDKASWVRAGRGRLRLAGGVFTWEQELSLQPWLLRAGGAVLGQVRPSLLLQRSCGVLLYEPQKVSHLGQELACYPGANFLLQHRGTGAFSILIFFSMANSNLLGGVVRALNFGA